MRWYGYLLEKYRHLTSRFLNRQFYVSVCLFVSYCERFSAVLLVIKCKEGSVYPHL